MLIRSASCVYALLADGRIAWWSINKKSFEPAIIEINAVRIAAHPGARILTVVTDDNRLLVYYDSRGQPNQGPNDITFYARKRGYSQELIQDVYVKYVTNTYGRGSHEFCYVILVTDISIRLLSVRNGDFGLKVSLYNYPMFPVGFDLFSIGAGYIALRTNQNQLQLLRSSTLNIEANNLNQFTPITGYQVQDINQIICCRGCVLFLLNDGHVFAYGIDPKILRQIQFAGGASIVKIYVKKDNISYLDTAGNFWYQSPSYIDNANPVRLTIFNGLFVENLFYCRVWLWDTILVQYCGDSDRKLCSLRMRCPNYGQEYIDGKKPTEIGSIGDSYIDSTLWFYGDKYFVMDDGLVYQVQIDNGLEMVQIPFFRENPIASNLGSQRIRSALTTIEGN